MATAVRTALITGAARGIGFECAKLMQAAGRRLVLVDRDAEPLAEAARALGTDGVLPIVADLSDRGAPAAMDAEISRKAAERNPTERLGRPEEVAAVIAFLASEQASYVNGAIVDVTGRLWAA